MSEVKERETTHTHTDAVPSPRTRCTVNERNSIMFIHSKKKDLTGKSFGMKSFFSCHRGRRTARDMDGWTRGDERVSGVRVIVY